MGYYLPRRSYLRPVTKPRVSQRILTKVTIGVSFLAIIIILLTIEFGNQQASFAAQFTGQEQEQLPLETTPVFRALDEKSGVQLTYITSFIEHNTSHITWETAIESENNCFIVERSENGKPFTYAGCVDSKSFTGALNSYTFEENVTGNPHELLYQLKYKNMRGELNFLAISKAETNSTFKKSLSIQSVGPETFNEYFNLTFYSEQHGSVSVEILNADGLTVFKAYSSCTAGLNNYRFIDGEQLSPGEYSLRVATLSGVAFSKLRKV